MSLHSSGRNRLEALLAYLSGTSVDVPANPHNRLEHYLLYLCKLSESFPASPRNRLECCLDHLCKHRGGGGDITLETLNVSENGTKNAPSGTAYNKVNVSVPVPTLDTLTAPDNGTYTPQSGHAYDEVIVNVPKGITPSGTLPITENGTFDVTQYAAAEVNVQSGGGGSGLELLVDDTAAEDVATINLVIPQGKQSLPAYVVVLNGETSASEWIYPHLNSTSPSQGQGAYFQQARIYDNTCFVVSQYRYGGEMYILPTNSGTTISTSAISNIFLSLYAASSTFKSGFNVKVYGVSI